MGFKKLIATGMILANLAMPVYAKMYNKSLETSMEKRYNIDLVGDFSDKEKQNISDTMKKLSSKINRKKAGIESIILKKTKLKGNDYSKDMLGTVDEKENAILLDAERMEEYGITKGGGREVTQLIGHEIGHLVYKTNQEEYFNQWSPYLTGGLGYEERTNITGLPGCSLPKGTVSEYPLKYSKGNCIGEIQEDFAETFAYWIKDAHYADKDKIVQEKIKIIKDKVGK